MTDDAEKLADEIGADLEARLMLDFGRWRDSWSKDREPVILDLVIELERLRGTVEESEDLLDQVYFEYLTNVCRQVVIHGNMTGNWSKLDKNTLTVAD